MKKLNLSIENQKEIIKLYKIGKSCNKISKIFCCCNETIRKILYKNNIEIRLRRKYNLDQNFFEEINDQEKAYCLGLWYADGCNFEKRDKIEIAMTDLDIIEKVKNCFKYDGPIFIRIRKKQKTIYKTCYRLQLTSKKMSQDLIKHGCVSRKSKILKFPQNVSSNLMPHFIRGLFDGDGTIAKDKTRKNRWRIAIYGTKNICEGMKNYYKCGNISLNRKNSKTGHETYQWTICDQNNVKFFLDWIYKEATIYLERKYNKYKNFSENKDIENV